MHFMIQHPSYSVKDTKSILCLLLIIENEIPHYILTVKQSTSPLPYNSVYAARRSCDQSVQVQLFKQALKVYSSDVSVSSLERWRAAARNASAIAVVSPSSPTGRLL